MQLDVLIPASAPGTVRGRALHLLEPISFWGGVSSTEGTLTDPRCSHHGEAVAGRVLLIRELRGSSSGSSVLLELAYRRKAPSAIVLAETDAILGIGVLVAREMAWPAPGLFLLSAEQQETIPEGIELLIRPDGQILLSSQHG